MPRRTPGIFVSSSLPPRLLRGRDGSATTLRRPIRSLAESTRGYAARCDPFLRRRPSDPMRFSSRSEKSHDTNVGMCENGLPYGRLAQRERRCFTRTRSGVRTPHRPPCMHNGLGRFRGRSPFHAGPMAMALMLWMHAGRLRCIAYALNGTFDAFGSSMGPGRAFSPIARDGMFNACDHAEEIERIRTQEEDLASPPMSKVLKLTEACASVNEDYSTTFLHIRQGFAPSEIANASVTARGALRSPAPT